MTPEIKAAVEKLTTSYGDVTREAKSYANLDAEAVRDAFLQSVPGTAEQYVLSLLAQNNPVGTMTATVIKGKSKAKLIKDIIEPSSIINEYADSPAE